MALCESQLDSALPQIKRDSSESDTQTSASQEAVAAVEPKHSVQPGETLYNLSQGGLPLTVDYRSPVSHFIPPVVELYGTHRTKPEPLTTGVMASNSPGSSESSTPVKRKRGRPRVDKTSPEYLAKSAARKQAREMAMNSPSDSGEKRKRGRPRIDKTSPEYLARKKAKELEALEKKAKRQYKRRATGVKHMPAKSAALQTRSVRRVVGGKTTKILRKLPPKHGNTAGRKMADKKAVLRRNSKFVKRKKDSAASSSTGEANPNMKRKYTKRAVGPGPGRPRKEPGTSSDRAKGKRGRPRKADLIAAGLISPGGTPKRQQQPKIRVRNNLMPVNSEPISLDSDDEPDLGSPSQASDTFSLDENLRALRHLHEKYANLERDEAFNAELVAANCKSTGVINLDDDQSSVKELETRVEKLEDSSNSDSDTSSSNSGSGSSSSSSSSSSSGSSSSSSSDSESSDDEKPSNGPTTEPNSIVKKDEDGRSRSASRSLSRSLSRSPVRVASDDGDVSYSDNESADKSVPCSHCPKWFSTRVTLKIHRRVHLNRGTGNSRSRNRSSARYECDCCNETFNRWEKLWEHKASAHRGSMTVRCSVCRKCFEDDAELAAHDATHTADERQGRCGSCGAVFQRHEQLARHRASAHGAPGAHSCPQCGKGFGHAHSLARHLHNHARQLYKCVVCKASFARADQLAQHLNSHLADYKRLKP